VSLPPPPNPLPPREGGIVNRLETSLPLVEDPPLAWAGEGKSGGELDHEVSFCCQIDFALRFSKIMKRKVQQIPSS
jgi:hypothetical protein